MNNAHPLTSMLLSAFLPGLGQWHNGQLSKAVYLILAYLFLSPLIFVFVTQFIAQPNIMDGLMVWLGFNLLLWLYAVVGAGWVAWRGAPLQHSWQSGGIYLAVILVSYAVLAPLTNSYVRNRFVESFKVPSGSMEPNIYAGDMLFASKGYNCPGCLEKVEHGDVVIFVYPNDRTQYFIKRVIALPGDEVTIKNTEIFVNGKALFKTMTLDGNDLKVTEQYEDKQWNVVWREKPTLTPQTNLKIPVGSIFVMGDNRSASHDARYFGPVPLRDVVGKATFIWGSAKIEGFKIKDINWNRFGLGIQ